MLGNQIGGAIKMKKDPVLKKCPICGGKVMKTQKNYWSLEPAFMCFWCKKIWFLKRKE